MTQIEMGMIVASEAKVLDSPEAELYDFGAGMLVAPDPTDPRAVLSTAMPVVERSYNTDADSDNMDHMYSIASPVNGKYCFTTVSIPSTITEQELRDSVRKAFKDHKLSVAMMRGQF